MAPLPPSALSANRGISLAKKTERPVKNLWHAARFQTANTSLDKEMEYQGRNVNERIYATPSIFMLVTTNLLGSVRSPPRINLTLKYSITGSRPLND